MSVWSWSDLLTESNLEYELRIMSVSLKCEAVGCTEIKRADDIPTCIALMQLHQRNVHEHSQRQPPPKISRPSVEQGVGEDDWAAFTRRWNMFRDCTELTPSQLNAQLLACCTPDLEASLFRDDPDIASRSEGEILASIHRLAVIHVILSLDSWHWLWLTTSLLPSPLPSPPSLSLWNVDIDIFFFTQLFHHLI